MNNSTYVETIDPLLARNVKTEKSLKGFDSKKMKLIFGQQSSAWEWLGISNHVLFCDIFFKLNCSKQGKQNIFCLWPTIKQT